MKLFRLFSTCMAILAAISIFSCSSGGSSTGTSDNAFLSNIAISGGVTISPAFKASTYIYTATVPSATASCSVTAFAGYTAQTLTANGSSITTEKPFDVTLSSAETAVAIQVTAASGTQNVYTLTIKKTGTVSNEARLSSLLVKSSTVQTITPVFSSDTLSYDSYVPYSVSSVTINATAIHTAASITVNGAATASGSDSAAIAVTAGATAHAAVHVSAEDGSTKDYSVTIHRASASSSNDAYLSSLILSSDGSWDTLFAKNISTYNITVVNTVSSIKVTPAVEESHATVTINGTAVASGSASGDIALTAGATATISVAVTAQDTTTTQSYTLNVTRQPAVSDNAYLSSLTLGASTLTPTFIKTTNTYTAAVTSSVSSVSVSPTAEDSTATITVNGSNIASGAAKDVTLGNAGTSTQITIVVTAASGKLNTYIVNVSRTNSLVIYFEKPSAWSAAWIWYDSDPSTTAWNTTVLATAPGDMTYYRTVNSLKWYMKDLGTASTVTFLFNDGTWNNQLKKNGTDFTTTASVWVRADGTTSTTDPVAPAAPVITVSPAGGTFSSDTCTVTLSIASSLNVTERSYTIVKNSGTPVTTAMTANTASINIATGTAAGDIVKLQVTALNSVGRSTTDQYVFTRTTPPVLSDDVDDLRIYQVMVEAFQDGDSKFDYNTGYGPSSHKGDLKGITNAIPYIKSLGCNAIWLTPIFNSNGSSQLDATGYFAYDYFTIDPKFGDLQAAKDLVKAAHDANMYVFLDGVFGHHKSSGCPASPSGYVPTGNTVNSPFSDGNYGVDYNDTNTVNYYKEVATYWIDQLEIDGWRLDQAYQMHKNKVNCWDLIVSAVQAKCAERKAANKEWGTLGYMVGEIWKGESDIKTYGYGSEGFNGLESCFDFPMRYNLVQVLAVEESKNYSSRRGDTSYLSTGYSTHSSYPSHAHPNLMLTNHDLVRFGDLLQRAGLGGKETTDYWKRHKAAFAFMTSYTGPITVYYGDEIGDEVSGFVNGGDGGYYDDHVSRSNGQISGFDSNQQALHDYVASLMTIRNAHPALWNGSRTNLKASGSQYADLKVSGTDKVLFVLNAGTTSTTLSLSQTTVGGTTLTGLTGESTVSASGGNYTITLSGLQGAFYSVK